MYMRRSFKHQGADKADPLGSPLCLGSLGTNNTIFRSRMDSVLHTADGSDQTTTCECRKSWVDSSRANG